MQNEKLLRETIRKIISTLLEGERGGGLTDFGALYRLEKNAAVAKARQAIIAADGDVDAAAAALEISPSTLRYYLDLQPSLERTQEKAAEEDEKSSK